MNGKPKYFSCSKLPADILFVEYEPDLKVDLAAAKEIVAQRLAFTKNKSHYVLIDITNVKEVTAEAKAYMQDPQGGLRGILGAAFLAHTPPGQLMAHIYTKTKADFPSRFFNDKEEALAWLKEIMAKDDGHHKREGAETVGSSTQTKIKKKKG
jgi:hypothetical protein